jgi:hypothetical protein
MIKTIVSASLIFFASVICVFAQEEKLTIATYYPSPTGVYQTLRIAPGGNPGDCSTDGTNEGKMYYDETSHVLNICANLAMGVWGYVPVPGTGGPWTLNGVNLFASNTAWNVGIGTAFPTEKLHVVGNITALNGNISSVFGNMTAYWNVAAQFGNVTAHDNVTAQFGNVTAHDNIVSQFGNVTAAWNVSTTFGNVSSGGNITVNRNITAGDRVTAAEFFYSSDRSLKTNIRPAQNSLDKILALTGATFTWKKDGRNDMGLIAQDVERVYPELVSTDQRTGLKSVEYGNLIAPLIEAIKEQQKQINILNYKIEQLRARKR